MSIILAIFVINVFLAYYYKNKKQEEQEQIKKPVVTLREKNIIIAIQAPPRPLKGDQLEL